MEGGVTTKEAEAETVEEELKEEASGDGKGGSGGEEDGEGSGGEEDGESEVRRGAAVVMGSSTGKG